MTEETYIKQIKALSLLSDINIQLISPALLYCSCTGQRDVCRKELCQSSAQNAAYYARELNQSCFYLCPAGLLRMVTPSLKTVRGAIFSGPFLMDGNENHPEFPPRQISPEQISALSELLFVLSERTESDFFSREKKELSVAVKSKDREDIFRICQNTLQKIIKDSKTDLYKIRFYCCRFALMLREVAVEMSHSGDKAFCLNRLLTAESTESVEQEMKNITENLVRPGPEQEGIRQNIAIDEAVIYVQKNYARKISQQEVAKAVYLSPSYFSHVFRMVKGVRFMDFVNRTRIEHARELLKNPLVKPETVYLKVGYQSRSYFIKTFKKITGLSPERYRKQYTKGL